MLIKVVVSTIMLGIFVSCKKPANSQVKTLENFALNSDVRINACSANIKDLEKDDPRKKIGAIIEVDNVEKAKILSVELMLALSAVPDEAMKIFIAQGGKVLISPDAPRFCAFGGAIRFKGKTPIFASCVVDIPNGSGKTVMQKGLEGRTLVMTPEPAVIRHGVVRTMGYMLADTLDNDAGFAKLKIELANAFLMDVASSSVFSLKAQEAILGENIDKIVRKNIKDRKSNLLQDSKASRAQVYQFLTYVMGESFDSYHCRSGDHASFDINLAKRIKKPSDATSFQYLTDTRKVMRHFFPRTYDVFRLVDAHMKGFASKLPNVKYRGESSNLALESAASELALDSSKTVKQRNEELQELIRSQAKEVREAQEQYTNYKSKYDSSWGDVWGTKKSEMDTARAVYNLSQSREKALREELAQAQAEEKKLGGDAKTSSDRQFSEVSTKVEQFDFHKELAKGVEDTAKTYGKNSGSVAGYVGESVGGEVGKAFGEGLGDGVAGVLGAFGKKATDAIKQGSDSIDSNIQYSKDVIADPTLAANDLLKYGKSRLTPSNVYDTTMKSVDRISKLGAEVLEGDTAKLYNRADTFIEAIPAAGSLYKTGKNVANFAMAKNLEEENAAIRAQRDLAADTIVDAGSAAFGGSKILKQVNNTVDRYSPSAAINKGIDSVKNSAQSRMMGGINSVSDLGTGQKPDQLRASINAPRNIEKAGETAKKTVEQLNKVGEYVGRSDSPAGDAMESLQQEVPGHANSGVQPSSNAQQPSIAPIETAMLSSPSVIASLGGPSISESAATPSSATSSSDISPSSD
jgi:hypothetical protein